MGQKVSPHGLRVDVYKRQMYTLPPVFFSIDRYRKINTAKNK